MMAHSILCQFPFDIRQPDKWQAKFETSLMHIDGCGREIRKTERIGHLRGRVFTGNTAEMAFSSITTLAERQCTIQTGKSAKRIVKGL